MIIHEIITAEEILQFWFPSHLVNDHTVMAHQFEWWFRGGANTAIAEWFSPFGTFSIPGTGTSRHHCSLWSSPPSQCSSRAVIHT
jgi:hypothetical protein